MPWALWKRRVWRVLAGLMCVAGICWGSAACGGEPVDPFADVTSETGEVMVATATPEPTFTPEPAPPVFSQTVALHCDRMLREYLAEVSYPWAPSLFEDVEDRVAAEVLGCEGAGWGVDLSDEPDCLDSVSGKEVDRDLRAAVGRSYAGDIRLSFDLASTVHSGFEHWYYAGEEGAWYFGDYVKSHLEGTTCDAWAPFAQLPVEERSSELEKCDRLLEQRLVEYSTSRAVVPEAVEELVLKVQSGWTCPREHWHPAASNGGLLEAVDGYDMPPVLVKGPGQDLLGNFRVDFQKGNGDSAGRTVWLYLIERNGFAHRIER